MSPAAAFRPAPSAGARGCTGGGGSGASARRTAPGRAGEPAPRRAEHARRSARRPIASKCNRAQQSAARQCADHGHVDQEVDRPPGVRRGRESGGSKRWRRRWWPPNRTLRTGCERRRGYALAGGSKTPSAPLSAEPCSPASAPAAPARRSRGSSPAVLQGSLQGWLGLPVELCRFQSDRYIPCYLILLAAQWESDFVSRTFVAWLFESKVGPIILRP
jgi:hypothetical protein